ncbi:SLAC1 anion channel family protein, partial [Helicobacter sp. MIT 14-3879]|uniref:SLAC1 anion channel family protein n=1 Tax=Helicobacter sp. MIT 14-3879 TaxID=2040649 RepID=UPI000E1E8C89
NLIDSTDLSAMLRDTKTQSNNENPYLASSANNIATNQPPINQATTNKAPINQPPINKAPTNQYHTNDATINQSPVNHDITNQTPTNQVSANQASMNQYLLNQPSINQTTTNQAPTSPATKGYFSYLPVSFFGACMGLSAMSVAWENMANNIAFFNSETIGTVVIRIIKGDITQHSIYVLAPHLIALFFALLAVVAFMGIFSTYTLKIITNFESFKQEFTSPLTRPFFGTLAISLLLIPLALQILCVPQGISFVIWLFGAMMMFAFSVHIVSFWIAEKIELSHITPAWIIPVVGLLDIPLAIPSFTDIEILQKISFIITGFCVAVGFFFTIVLFVLILGRIVFFQKLPEKLMPTLVILLAPFGVGVSAYTVLIRDFSLINQNLFIINDVGIDQLGFLLLFMGLFLFLALLPQVLKIKQCCPFRISWWAISFPLAALCIASLKISNAISTLDIKGLPPRELSEMGDFSYAKVFFFSLSSILLCFVTLAFIWLLFRTLGGILKGELKNLA